MSAIVPSFSPSRPWACSPRHVLTSSMVAMRCLLLVGCSEATPIGCGVDVVTSRCPRPPPRDEFCPGSVQRRLPGTPGLVAESLLRIGELSRRSGFSADVIRAWERRYDLLRPNRTDGGYRLYSADDISRL